jgi:hypothetical protein
VSRAPVARQKRGNGLAAKKRKPAVPLFCSLSRVPQRETTFLPLKNRSKPFQPFNLLLERLHRHLLCMFTVPYTFLSRSNSLSQKDLFFTPSRSPKSRFFGLERLFFRLGTARLQKCRSRLFRSQSRSAGFGTAERLERLKRERKTHSSPRIEDPEDRKNRAENAWFSDKTASNSNHSVYRSSFAGSTW